MSDTVFDTHEIARSLTDADFTLARADAIAAVRRAAEYGDHGDTPPPPPGTTPSGSSPAGR